VFPNAWRQGDFSGVTDSLGRNLTIYDPWSTQSQANRWARTPYVNNQIPMTKESPFAKYLYGVTPGPTLPDVNPAFSNNFFGTASNASTQNTTSFKIDHWISERDRFFARYSFGTSSSAGPPTSSQGAATTDLSTNITYRQSHDKSMSLSWTHTFSPSFFSETFAGVSYTNYDIYTGDFYQDWSGQLGLPNPFGSSGFPNVTGTGVNMTFVQGDTRRQNKSLIYNIDQNFTKIAGKHEVQFGGKFRMDRANVLPDQQYASGLFDFASNATGLYDPTSGSSYSATPQSNFTGADFFLGLASSYRNQLNPKAYHFSAGERAVYVQDNWRVQPRLTLTLGMRYEYNPPFKDKVGLLQSFDLKNMAIVDTATMDQLYQAQRTTPAVVNSFTSLGVKFETPDQAGMSPGLINPYKTNFGPRAGFAWRSFGGRRPLVIRGGLGMYDYSPPLRDFNASTRSNPPFNASFSTNYTNAASSPDGLTNYLLRSVPTVVAGVNSANAVNPNAPGAVTPGSFTVVFFDPNYPDTRVADWNVSLEREVIPQIYARVTYAGTHGWNLNQDHMMNESPNAYIWYMTTGLPTASGTYANTAERPLNQTTYGNLEEYAKTGWSNSNSLQLQLQRRASRGVAFQVFYTLNNAFRAGGNGWHDGVVSDPNVYLPGAVPTDFDARNRLLYYSRDTAIPKHRIRWNWLIDVPVGKGKKFAQNAGPKLNRAIGGWQLAGIGSWRSRYFTLPTTNYGTFGPVETYGLQYPVQDCRSGQCIAGYLYWNGYIQANQINTYNAAGQCTGICGVPTNYKPSNSPVIPYPATPIPNDPAAPYYGTNTVYVPMKSGAPQRTTINTNLHPWQNQFVMGPGSFALDASLFKVVPIRERLTFRLQADFFSVLNNPGMGTPGSNGIISLQNSSNSARVMQLNGRLTW
jgi:hypothetical protein